MSKKKNKHLANQPATKQEISIQDDPYWRVSPLYMDPHRVGKYIIKFDKLDEEYPEWTEMLLDGFPTFYCILGIMRGASEEEIEKAYQSGAVGFVVKAEGFGELVTKLKCVKDYWLRTVELPNAQNAAKVMG